MFPDDGTIFQYSILKPEEDTSVWNKLVIVDREGRKGMQMPCAYLDGCSCSIYKSKPEVCATYKCLLLRRYNNDKVSLENAKKVIKRTKFLKDDFEREFNEFYIYNDDLSLRANIEALTEVVGGRDKFKTFINDHEDIGISIMELRKIIRNQFIGVKKQEETKK